MAWLDQDGKDLRFAATLTIHVGQAWCTPLRLLPAAATYHCSCIQTERCDCSYFAGVGPVELTNNRLVLGPPAAAKNIENRIESKQSDRCPGIMKVGSFTLEIINAESREPMKEFEAPDGKVYIEAEPDVSSIGWPEV